MAILTEDFAGAAADLGSPWVQLNASGKIRRDGSGLGTMTANLATTRAEAYDGVNTYANDQYSKCVVKRRTVGGGYDECPGLSVRASGTTGSVSEYLTLVDGASYLTQKYVAGSFTGIQSGSVTVPVNGVLVMNAIGTAIKTYVDGVQYGTTITDSSIASGAAGISFYSNAGSALPAQIDNWEGGNGTGLGSAPLTASVTDGMVMSDTVSALGPKTPVSVTDGMKMSDTVSVLGPKTSVSRSDSMVMSDDLTVTLITDTGPDNMKMSDTVSAAYKRLIASLSDGIVMSDAVTPALTASERVLSDSMRMSDSPSASYRRYIASLSDGMKMRDIVFAGILGGSSVAPGITNVNELTTITGIL